MLCFWSKSDRVTLFHIKFHWLHYSLAILIIILVFILQNKQFKTHPTKKLKCKTNLLKTLKCFKNFHCTTYIQEKTIS